MVIFRSSFQGFKDYVEHFLKGHEDETGNQIKPIYEYFAHYHTGGVPGRAEIDETQELNYPAIIQAIQETGYTGYLGQEFIPKRPDKLASLKQGVQICTVA